MKRYAVFAGATYYARGGWEDYQQSFVDASEAIDFAGGLAGAEAPSGISPVEWWQVVDLEERALIRTSGTEPYTGP